MLDVTHTWFLCWTNILCNPSTRLWAELQLIGGIVYYTVWTSLKCLCNNQKNLCGASERPQGYYILRYVFTASSHMYLKKKKEEEWNKPNPAFTKSLKSGSTTVSLVAPINNAELFKHCFHIKVCARTLVSVCDRVCVCGCVDGSWEADTVQENHPLATDLFGRW